MRNSPPPSSVEDVVELMHHIQLRLPVKDAARTSVLSKSWRHAWSTIPTLRFHVGRRKHMKVVDVERTLSSLLEKIDLFLDKQYKGRGRNTVIKIKNLARLHEVIIFSVDGDSTDLEISGVPNLRLFRCDLCYGQFGVPDARPFSAHSISIGSNVTELRLGSLITDESCLEMIKSGFPILESFTLVMDCWTLPNFHFTCTSLKTLSLMWPSPHSGLIDVQVCAPKLLHFFFRGYTLPSLSFPVSTLVQTKFKLQSVDMETLDVPFFLNTRKALTLSTKCNLCVTTIGYMPDIDLNDLRTRLPFPPANNVEKLVFETEDDYECRSVFFDAFFEICHPKHVLAKPEVTSQPSNHFFELMLREVLEKKKTTITKTSPYWPRHLKRVQIRPHHKWETLRISHRTFLHRVPIHFKLNWR